MKNYIESGQFKSGGESVCLSHSLSIYLSIFHEEGTPLNRISEPKKGALLNSKPEDENDPTKFDFYGSTITIVAASREEVISILSNDIYTTSGVWDVEKVRASLYTYPPTYLCRGCG